MNSPWAAGAPGGGQQSTRCAGRNSVAAVRQILRQMLEVNALPQSQAHEWRLVFTAVRLAL
jgi:hypothetical protein